MITVWVCDNPVMSLDSNLSSIRPVLRDAMPELAGAYGVESLAVFGSVARGEATAGSDVDLLVRFHGHPPGLFGFVRLERQLSELLGRPVDLVTESALKPRLRDQILAESVAV